MDIRFCGGTDRRHVRLKGLRESSLQELSQFRGRLELRDRLQFFECRSESVRQTPDRPRAEFLVLRLEVQVMHGPGQVLWRLQFAFHERLVDDYLRGDVGEFSPLPRLDLLSHGLEVALHPVNSDRYAIDQRERLRVFGEHRRKHTGDNVSKFWPS
jgi:hypothetical protein